MSSTGFDTPQIQLKLPHTVNEMPKLPYSKVQIQHWIDWLNSFDDSYLVLVSKLPHDLADGIVLSHLVGIVTCSENDREKIFELLNYPGADNPLHSIDDAKVLDNFELAVNVLRFSDAYTQSTRFKFLDEPTMDGMMISPESLAGGNQAHLLAFLNGIEQLHLQKSACSAIDVSQQPTANPLHVASISTIQ